MHIRKILFFIILTILLFPAFVAASTEKQQGAGLFFVENTVLDGGSSSYFNVFLLCGTEIEDGASGLILSVGGEMNVKGYVDGIIFTLFTKTVSTAHVKYGIINLRYFGFPFMLLFGLLLLSAFTKFFGKTTVYFEQNEKGVLKFGLSGYIMAILLIGIFFISVAGAVIATFGLACLFLVTIVGYIPVSLFLGYRVMNKYSKDNNIYVLFSVGLCIIYLLKSLPYIGEIISYFAMPLLSLGIFSVYIIHRYYYRNYITDNTAMSEKGGKQPFDRMRIKSIILSSVNADNELGGNYNEKK